MDGVLGVIHRRLAGADGEPELVVEVRRSDNAPMSDADERRALAWDEPRVTSEPLTYRPGAAVSYFRDLVLAQRNDDGARERLERHASEMEVQLPAREERARRARERGLASLGLGFETRVAPNRTQGQGGYFAPPLWLIDHFATAPRPARVLAELAPSFPLPQGVQSVNLPRLTTGLKTDVMTDASNVPSQDMADASASSPVVTIAGQGDVPVQLIEQSPAGAHLDWAIFKDLAADYDARFETQLIAGSGSGGQLTGLLTVAASGGTELTYSDASPTMPELYPYFGQAAAAIGNNRNLPPEVWLMRTARWAWIGGSVDNDGQPYSSPAHAPSEPPSGLFDPSKPTPVAPILGWPNYPNDAIPANRGTGSNEDRIIACRPTDLILLESEPRTAVNMEPLSGNLQARLQLRGYVAALTGRYPAGVAVIKGTGMIVQAGFGA
jgi:HK97 family phage major capsid protein